MMLKAQRNTIVGFLLGAALTAGGTSLYLTQTGLDAERQPAVSPILFPKTPMASITPMPSPAHDQTGLDDVATMIGRLAQRLERNPNNPDGWRMLGWSYLATGQDQQAVKAYGKAIELKGDVAEYRSAYGEALVKVANGIVTPAAKTAFDSALAIDSGDARSRFFVGLAKKQSGDAQGAYDIWVALMKDAPPNESFMQDLRTHMASLSQELGMDTPANVLPDRPAAPDDAVSESGTAQPGGEMGKILGMVEGLAQRLKDAPDDADGWRMLGKSYGVLGNHMGSIQAYARLLELRPDDPSARRRHAEAVLKTVRSGEPYPASLSGSLSWLHRQNSKDEFALFHLGEFYSRAGNNKLAAKYWHSLLEVLPKNSSKRAAVRLKLRN